MIPSFPPVSKNERYYKRLVLGPTVKTGKLGGPVESVVEVIRKMRYLDFSVDAPDDLKFTTVFIHLIISVVVRLTKLAILHCGNGSASDGSRCFACIRSHPEGLAALLSAYLRRRCWF